jgi:hypothetical protein
MSTHVDIYRMVDADRDAVRAFRIEHIDVLDSAVDKFVVQKLIQFAHRAIRKIEGSFHGRTRPRRHRL